MAGSAPKKATVHELGSDSILHVSERLSHSARLIHDWLGALEAGTSEDAVISPASLHDVISGLVKALAGYAESLPNQNLSAVLTGILRARCAELEYTKLILKQLTLSRDDPEWRALLLAWVRAADRSVSICAAVAEDTSKRLRGPRVRRAQADENNSSLINSIALYRTDPRTGSPRSARTIALWLRRTPGFDTFTKRRSDEALTRLVQRILRKL